MSMNLTRRIENLEKANTGQDGPMVLFQTRSSAGHVPPDREIERTIANAVRSGRIRRSDDAIRFVTIYEDRPMTPAEDGR